MFSGVLQKITYRLTPEVTAELILNNSTVELNAYLGKEINITLTAFNCLYCGKSISKPYQGYCFLCTKTLARCDICMVRPEKCHFAQGTCREPEWGNTHCNQEHILYLAITSDIKVGITRARNIPYRWLEQGAIFALPIATLPTRKAVGDIEVLLAQYYADKTNWRKLVQQDATYKDLQALLPEIKQYLKNETIAYLQADIERFTYPIQAYPNKSTSLKLTASTPLTGKLIGVKGQYLLLEHGVFNVRSHGGHNIVFA